MTAILDIIRAFLLALLYGPPRVDTYIAERTCKLPPFDEVYVYVSGGNSFYLQDHSLVEPLTQLSGPSMWRGYDHPGDEMGIALPAEQWIQVRLKNEGRIVAVIRFERNVHGVFLWFHPDMDDDGEPRGWHPCAVIEVDRTEIENWLKEARNG